MLTSASFFNLAAFPHAALFAAEEPVWLALTRLKEYITGLAVALPAHPGLASGVPLAAPMVLHENRLLEGNRFIVEFGDATKGKLVVRQGDQVLDGATVIMAGAILIGTRIMLGRGVLVESGALIKEPAIIGDYSEVRQGAYLRGHCLAGMRCVLGHTTEVKHSIFLNDAKAGHFAYVGDSILGGNTNLGAGTKLANLRFLPGTVRIRTSEGVVDSGLRKLGAIFGDQVQTGCNSVTSPGTLLGPESLIMPNTTVPSGYHPAKSVLR